jgi:hypothetical protein
MLQWTFPALRATSRGRSEPGTKTGLRISLTLRQSTAGGKLMGNRVYFAAAP